MIRSLILLADGFEECEALCVYDVLKRGGVDTVLCGVNGISVLSSHSVKITCDTTLSEKTLEDDWDIIFLPGGMPGAANLGKSPLVSRLVKSSNEKLKIVSAICASPAVVLGPLGILDGRKAVCYPGCESYYPSFSFSDEGVVVSGNVVTAKSAGYAFDLGLELLSLTVGESVMNKVKESIYYKEKGEK